MRQVWITKPGPPEVLQVRTAADPEPAAGQVRIRVRAAGVNFADTMARVGMYPDAPKPPCVVGYEVAGEVDALGAGVTTRRIGERVLALVRFGGYSDVVCTPEQQVVPTPDGMSDDEAAAIPVVYLTAHHMLVYLGNVKKDDTVLIHAAAGGVGIAALQLCKHVGARTIGTASASKHDFLRSAGLDHAIDYHTEDFEEVVKRVTDGRGVDIALDAQGGSSLRKSYRSLASTGRLFIFGAASFVPEGRRSIVSAVGGLVQTPIFHPLPLMGQNRGVLGVNVGHLWNEVGILRRQLDALMVLYRAGAVKPVIDSKVAFDDAPAAHRRIAERKNVGKVLLIP
jgi:NADPH:quinone reductase-like Zn-dependent oxidoreductase